MRPLQITTGKTVRSGRVTRVRTSWEQLAARLGKFRTTGISLAEYAQLGVDEKLVLKDSFGFFIGGWFSDQGRKRDQLVARSVLTLDIDYLDPWDIATIAEVYAAYEFVTHSTMSHTADKPKLRLVFPLSRDVTLDEYEPIARMVGSWFDINAVDKVSYRPAQLMYWPAVCSDGDPLYSLNHGLALTPEKVLELYDDWKDNFSWPVATKDSTPRPTGLRAEDPLSKPGIVGAFCRSYSIYDAIRTFGLPYIGTEDPERYTPVGATGSEGAVVYDDGLFLYSHHSNDVASNKNLNAWDLVRLCKFGHMDEGCGELTPISQLPSQKNMVQFAASDTRVKQTFDEADFENLDAVCGTEPPVVRLPAPVPQTDAWDDSGSPPVEAQSRLSFPCLLEDIENYIAGGMSPERCKDFVTDICAARCDPTDTGLLLKALQRVAKKSGMVLSLESLREQLLVAGKRLTMRVSGPNGEIRDIEEDLVGEILNEHFNNGRSIRRVAGKFWTYNEGLWSIVGSDEQIDGAIAQTFVRLRKDRPEAVRELVAAVGETKTSALSRQLSTMFTNLLAVRSAVSTDPLYLMRRFPLPVVNCRNVEIMFDAQGKRSVREHVPEHFHTVRVDTDYDPRAEAPTWDAFCHKIFAGCVDPEGMTRHLEEVCGYAIQMSRWLKCWVLLHGPTNTGKTTVADVLKSLLGGAVLERELQSYASANRSNFAESDLIGKLLLVDDDQAKGALLPDGFLKKVSEEKPITAEIKFGGAVMFVCRALPLMCSNHWPATRDLSDALRERAVVFPFVRPFKAAERSDAAKNRMLNEERSGILNRFIAGIERLRARGTWDPPIDALGAAEAWVTHSNPLAQFAHDRMVVDKSVPTGKCVKSSDLWASYVGWCAENVPDRKFRLPQRTFLDQLEALGYTRARDSKGLFRYRGIASLRAGEE